MKLLDLFCGAGGAAMGYHRAGFDEIVGIDNQPQPRYPFDFVQTGALEYLVEHGHEFDAIHASPPCQGYSIMRNLPWLKDREYPLLIDPVRELLQAAGRPWVIENVMGAHLDAGWLCGTMFGLPFYRHRAFDSNWFWLQPGHEKHGFLQGMPGAPKPRGSWEKKFEEQHPGESVHAALVSESVDNRGLATWPGRRDQRAGLAIAHNNPVNSAWRKYHDGNGAQANGVGVGHAKGWRLAAEAMGIDWMKREELTQAIPPAYTEFIGRALIQVSDYRREE